MSNSCRNCARWNPLPDGQHGYCPVQDQETFSHYGCIEWVADPRPILDEPPCDQPDDVPAEHEGSACAGIVIFGALLVAVAVLTALYLIL